MHRKIELVKKWFSKVNKVKLVIVILVFVGVSIVISRYIFDNTKKNSAQEVNEEELKKEIKTNVEEAEQVRQKIDSMLRQESIVQATPVETVPREER